MPTQLSFDRAHSALLCMDYQTGIVSTYVKDQDLLLRAAIVLKQARSAGMPIIHVQVGFRPKFPEISPATPRSAQLGTPSNTSRWLQVPPV